MKFDNDFPSHVIVSPVKSKFVYLRCHAKVEGNNFLHPEKFEEIFKLIICFILLFTLFVTLVDSSVLKQFLSTTPFNHFDYGNVHGFGSGLDDGDDDGSIEELNRHKSHNKQSRTHFNDLIADDDHPVAPSLYGVENEEPDDEDYDDDDGIDEDDGNSLLSLHKIHSQTRFQRSAQSFRSGPETTHHHQLMRHPKRFSNQQQQQQQQMPPSFQIDYTWYRNGELLLATTSTNMTRNGFQLNPNGTLRIQYSNHTSGIYRCLANETRYGIGATLSNNVIVNVASKLILFV